MQLSPLYLVEYEYYNELHCYLCNSLAEMATGKENEEGKDIKHKKKVKRKVKLSEYRSRKQVKKICNTRALKRVSSTHDGCIYSGSTLPVFRHRVK